MSRLIEDYAVKQLLGQGQYGKVYKAYHTKTKHQYAVKVVPVSRFRQIPKLQQCTVNQLQTLSNIQPCPHIVGFKQMLRTVNNFYFIYEYCNGGTLEHLIKRQRRLPQGQALLYFKQLLTAFKTLQKYNIMHRDIKPDNILFHNGVLKLGDFGFCKILGDTDAHVTQTMIGSPIYMGPEILKGEKYASKADIWSLGVVLFEMMFGYCPFQSNSIARLISKVEEGVLRIPLEINMVSEETQELLKRMLTKRPEQRIDWQSLFALEITEEGVLRKGKSGGGSGKQDLAVSPLAIKNNTSVNLAVPDNGRMFQPSVSYEVLPRGNYMGSLPDAKISSSGNLASLSLGGNLGSNLSNLSSIPSNLSATAPSFSPPTNPPPPVPTTFPTPTSTFTPTSTQPHSHNPKRKHILQQHIQCTNAIKIACQLSQSDDPQALTYSYLLLKKSQQRLRRICQQISVTQIEFEDVMFAVNGELRQLEREIALLKQELISNGVEMRVLGDARRYLSGRFSEEVGNVRVWYEMVGFLFGGEGTGGGNKGNSISVNGGGCSNSEMVMSIKGKLISL